MVRRHRRVRHRLGAGVPHLSRPGRRSAHYPVWRRNETPPAEDIDQAKALHAEYKDRKKALAAAKETGDHMALTRNFKQTVIERVARDPQFAKALLDEAATLFLSGEPETARLILHLVNATIGFEQLAEVTETPSKSLRIECSRPEGIRAWTTSLRFLVPCVNG